MYITNVLFLFNTTQTYFPLIFTFLSFFFFFFFFFIIIRYKRDSYGNRYSFSLLIFPKPIRINAHTIAHARTTTHYRRTHRSEVCHGGKIKKPFSPRVIHLSLVVKELMKWHCDWNVGPQKKILPSSRLPPTLPLMLYTRFLYIAMCLAKHKDLRARPIWNHHDSRGIINELLPYAYNNIT